MTVYEGRLCLFGTPGQRLTGARTYAEEDVSLAPDLDRGPLVVLCDARDRTSGRRS